MTCDVHVPDGLRANGPAFPALIRSCAMLADDLQARATRSRANEPRPLDGRGAATIVDPEMWL